MLLYKLFLFTYPKVAKWLGLFNQKAKQWTIGQNQVWNEITEKQKQLSGFPVIWFHAASFGEFEQGLPIIEAIKIKHPQYKIWVTFFSPSGYLYRKNDPSVDAVTYLPFDSPENAVRFINTIKPKLIVFIKYEFWYYYLTEAKNRQIPIILASAIFRPNQIFFKWYGSFYKKMLSLFSSILVQDEEMYELVAPIIKKTRLFISGDTRFDRVYNTSKELNSINWMQQLSGHKNIIAGSTWKEDELILFKTTAHFTQFNWIIVPHHVDEKSIASTKKIFTNAITLTELIKSEITHTKPIVLIVDKIGLLRTLYQYAHISYVGGGFGKDGVHNVLEPAAFGIPVIWGYNDAKYKEAIGLRKNNGGYHIKNEAELVMHLNELLNTSGCYELVSNNASSYIQNHTGATKKTMKEIDIQLDKP
jgi:3-deoxy-D-manno-octulosonic-acid transferase